ncbi:MAG: choice-of-anchor R domain-containing protein [Phycisphaerales bacterium JB039]
MMKVGFHRAAAAAGALTVVAATAGADEIISNLPGNDGSQSAALEGGRIKAMGFTMPAGEDYNLDSVDVRLDVTGDVDPLVRIFSDSGGVPTTELAELVDPAVIGVGIETYSFTPPATLALEGGQTYWIVVYNIGAGSIDWKASSPGIIPTGIATHAGGYFSTTSGPLPPTTSSTILNSYGVQATPVSAMCYPDCDESGTLDFFDFLCFQNAFAQMDPYADCDGSGTLDFFDFLCFQNEFAAGCP